MARYIKQLRAPVPSNVKLSNDAKEAFKSLVGNIYYDFNLRTLAMILGKYDALIQNENTETIDQALTKLKKLERHLAEASKLARDLATEHWDEGGEPITPQGEVMEASWGGQEGGVFDLLYGLIEKPEEIVMLQANLTDNLVKPKRGPKTLSYLDELVEELADFVENCFGTKPTEYYDANEGNRETPFSMMVEECLLCLETENWPRATIENTIRRVMKKRRKRKRQK